VIQAAKEKGVYAFGAVSDQNKLAPDTVVTSFVLDPVKVYDSVFKMINMNNFTGTIFYSRIRIVKEFNHRRWNNIHSAVPWE
jgi:basic membrane lipoprotein Med (substrate-binding protein (PBP1-ABC) superfamily)